MSFNEFQQGWFKDYLDRDGKAADTLPSEPTPQNGELPSSKEFQQKLTNYQAQMQSLSANPVLMARNKVREELKARKIEVDPKDPGAMKFYGDGVNAALEAMKQAGKEGGKFDFNIAKIIGFDMPDLKASPKNITGMWSSAQAKISNFIYMLNPLHWPIGEIAGKILGQLPIVRQAFAMVEEKGDWDRAGMRVALEDVFTGPNREAMIQKALADYDDYKKKNATPPAPKPTEKATSATFPGAPLGMAVPAPTGIPANALTNANGPAARSHHG